MIAGKRHHAGEIGGAVGAGLVGPKVEPHGHARAAARQSRADRLHAFVVEAKAVDRRAVLGQAEQTGFVVAGLGQGRGGPDLDKAETRVGQRRDGGGVLVKARGKADRVGQAHPGKRGFQPFRCDRTGCRGQTKPQCGDRQTMGRFGVNLMQGAQPQLLGHALHANSSVRGSGALRIRRDVTTAA